MTTTQRERPVVRSQVEPKIVERRRAVLDDRRRRRRNRWIALGVVVGVVAAVLGALWSPLADVDRVVVQGTDVIDHDELRALTGIETGDQLVTLDLAAARDGVRSHPMVASASVVREWPDTVRLVVRDEVPLAQLRDGDVVHPVSTSGRVLPPDVAGLDALAVLSVPDLHVEVGDRVPDPIAAALVVHVRMGPSLREQLASTALGADGTLSFELVGGGTVRFGPVQAVPAKLVAIDAFLSQVALECLATLDVERPDRPTASRIPGCAVPPPTETDLGPDPAPGPTSGPTDGGAPEADDLSDAVPSDTPQ